MKPFSIRFEYEFDDDAYVKQVTETHISAYASDTTVECTEYEYNIY